MSDAWDEEARRDLERRGGSAVALSPKRTELGISGHYESDRAATAEAEEGSGNGRTGLQLKLTVRQVTTVLGIAVTLAAGAVGVWTREPAKSEPARATAAESRTHDTGRLEEIARQLQAEREAIESLRAEGRETREQVRDMRGDVHDVQVSVRTLERLAREAKAATPPGGGGSK